VISKPCLAARSSRTRRTSSTMGSLAISYSPMSSSGVALPPWPRSAASAIKESESLKLRGKSHAHRPTTRHYSQGSPRSRSV
jgi:hypothetical protein